MPVSAAFSVVAKDFSPRGVYLWLVAEPSPAWQEMFGTEEMQGRLNSSLRFIDIKTLRLEKPSALQPLASRATN